VVIEKNSLKMERVIQGLMRLNTLDEKKLYELIKYDIEHGVHFFDISDIYGRSAAETKLGNVLKEHPELRSEMIIQSKCGIIKEDNDVNYYDLSYKHIVDSCYASLKRLNIDYIDYYLLHRPDIFMNAHEVAQAISELKISGKVKHFGVSNFPHEMVKYLYDQTNIPIEINQLQLGLGHLDLVREVLNCNMNNNEGCEHTGELFFYMKRYNISLQCWSPFQIDFFEGSIFTDERYKKTNEVLDRLANKYHASKCAIATAFLLNLGDNIQVITGSTDPKHVQETIDGKEIILTKPEWYELYRSTGNMLP
jgi:predicted oxidoreductase